jgi:hypothetical protein
MMGQEIRELPSAPEEDANFDVVAQVELADSCSHLTVRVAVAASETNVRAFASAMVFEDMSEQDLEISLEAFGEFVRAIAGRVRAALDTIGVTVDQRDSSVRAGAGPDGGVGAWERVVHCATADGRVFLVALTFA